jgi:hypothetical protein
MQTLLVLNINPELEADMIDFMLANPDILSFTSYHVHSHGAFPDMSISEQVSGRRKRIKLEVMLDQSAIGAVLSSLKKEIGKDILYWEQAISNAGRID